MLNETYENIYDHFNKINCPAFESVIGSETYSDEYKRGFSEAFYSGKANLLHALLMAPFSTREEPTGTKNPELLEYFFKVIGRIEAFYHLTDSSDEMDGLFTLIQDDLCYIKECITEIIKDE